jgi:hypothetical protein
VSSLFLLVLLLLGLGSSTGSALADKASLRAGVTELPVGVLLALVVANSTLLEDGGVLDGQDVGADDVLARLGGLDILSGGVTLLGLAVAAGEEDEALAVLLEALDVGLEGLLREVLAARVDGDTDGAGELAGNASS